MVAVIAPDAAERRRSRGALASQPADQLDVERVSVEPCLFACVDRDLRCTRRSRRRERAGTPIA